MALAEHIKSLWSVKLEQSAGDSLTLYQCSRIFLLPVEIKVEDYLVKAVSPLLCGILFASFAGF